MAKSRPSDFTRADYDKLLEAKRLLHDALPEIDKAESCGVECESWRQIHGEMAKRLDNIELNYFSGMQPNINRPQG